MAAVNALIRERMASEHAPRIPEVTAHLVEAGGKRLRPMLTLAAARMCGYGGPFHVHLAATVEFIHTATLLHDDVVDESQRGAGGPRRTCCGTTSPRVLVGDYLFARLPADGRNRQPARARHPVERRRHDRRGRGAATDRRAGSRHDERIYLQVCAARPRRCSRRRPRRARRDRRCARGAGRALRDYGDALGIASRSPMTCWITAARRRRSARTPATISASAR
jgi:octaprenyl-diphosphate synthase